MIIAVMTFSVSLRISLLVLLGVTYAVCSTSSPNEGLSSLIATNINFPKYARENGGHWNFAMVPKTDFFKDVKKMWLVNKQTSVDGLYETKIQYKTTSGTVKEFINERVHSISNGQATAVSKDKSGIEETFTITFVKYVPKTYLYYLVSRNDEGDEDGDYRYVLAHKKLDKKSLQEIKTLDMRLGFQAELQDMEQ